MTARIGELSISGWLDFLNDWSRDALALQRRIGIEELRPLAQSAVDRDSCVFPPADATEIAEAEDRLGTRLPMSYRNFLLASNGFAVLALDVDDALIRPVGSICWLKEGEPALVSAWTRNPRSVSDQLYLDYGPSQDCVHIRTEYLPSLLQVSDFVESAMLMLNPLIKTPKGEWEGWDFGTAKPGAYRFRTFQDLMFSVRESTLANLQNTIQFLELMKNRPPRPTLT